MKKTLKISLFVIAVFTVGLLLLYFFRNPIVSFTLRKIIASESAEKITLSLSHVEFDPFQGSVSLFDPSLNFSNVFLHSNKAMKVDNLSFEKLGIYDVSVRDLLLERHLVAEKVQVFKPAVHLEVMSNATADTNRFSPDKLFGLLNTNSNTFTSVFIKISEVEIRYGSINMQTDTVSDFTADLLDYTLLLKEFATKSESTVPHRERILYSDEVIFQLRNIYKHLNSGYDLQIDSVIYSSKWEHLITNGLLLDPVWENDDKTNKSSIAIQQIKLDGLGIPELRGLEKFHLNKLEISNVALTNYLNDPNEKPHKAISLPKLLNDFALDSLIFNQFSYYKIQGENDTIIVSENTKLLVDGISFDSTLMEDPVRNLKFGDAMLSSEYLKFLEVQEGVSIAYDGVSYSSENKQFDLEGVSIQTDSLNFHGPQLDLDMASLQVNGFSIHDFFQKKKQFIQLKLFRPTARIDLSKLRSDVNSSDKKPNKYLDLLVFQKFKIEEGIVKLSDDEKFRLDLSDLNLETDGLNLINEDTLKQLSYDFLQFDLDKFELSVSKGAAEIKAAKMSFDDQNFSVNGFHSRYNQQIDGRLMNVEFEIGDLSAASFDLNDLFFHNYFSTASIKIRSSGLTGQFPFPGTEKAESKGAKRSSFQLPVNFHVGELILDNSFLDISLEQSDDTIQFQTKLNLELGEINSNEDSFATWLNPSDWKIELTKLTINSREYDLQSDAVSLNARKSELKLNEVRLMGKPNVGLPQKKLNIKKINLPKVVVNGLNYSLFIQNDSIRFTQLFVENPDLVLSLYHGKDFAHQSAQQKKFDFGRLLEIVYDTIDLNGLQLHLTNYSDTSHSFIKLGNFNLNHVARKGKNSNLMREIALQMDDFSVQDSINNTLLHMQKMVFDPELLTLAVDNIDWFKKPKDSQYPQPTYESTLSINSSKILFSGTYLSETLPSNLRFDKLKFRDLDITYLDRKNIDNPQKEELDFDLVALKKYTDLINRITIDTTVFDDISLHLKTIEGIDENLITMDSIGLVVNKIDVDTSMLDQKNPILVDNLIIDLNERTRISRDSLYEIKTGLIHYNFPEHQITVDSFYVLPRFDEEECFRRAEYQKGIIDLFAQKAEFNDLRVGKLLNNKELHFGGIDVFGVRLNIVKDKKYPIEPGSHIPMPQDMIRNISQKVQIDSIRVFDSYIYFKLYPEKKSNQPGEIFLDKLNARLYGFSNIFTNVQDPPKLEVFLNTNLMGESRMDANFHFPLMDTANNWWFSFKTEDIDFTKLNSMTRHLVGLTILRGKGSVDAPLIIGDDFSTKGKILFRYKKIRLSLYNRKKAETVTGVFSSMANFFINDLVIKSNNPKFARKPRIGVVFAERDTQKFIVNYAFKSVLSGMLSTLGINDKDQRKTRKVYKKKAKQNN